MTRSLIRSGPGGFRAQHGAAAVEFAFGIVLMLLITAGIFEFGRAFWYYNALDKATRDAARYLSALPGTEMTNPTTAAAAIKTAQDLVVAAVNNANVRPAIDTSKVAVTCDAACGVSTKPLNITVSITGFSIRIGGVFPFVGGPTGGNYGDIGLAPHTTMRYMN